MLCKDIENLITGFVDTFDDWESLPELKSVQRLVTKSDTNLLKLVCLALELPFPVLHSLMILDKKEQSFMIVLQMTPARYLALDSALAHSMDICWQTASVFWLFIAKPDNIYHGGYTNIFERSLLYQLLNIVTSTEEGSVCLGRTWTTEVECVFHLS